MTGSQKPEGVFTRQQRIAELAKQSLDTLQHGLLRELLRQRIRDGHNV